VWRIDGRFDVPPSSEEWRTHGSEWYGGAGQRELRFRYATDGTAVLARLHVAAPGGCVSA
jgi:hypothetical protein